MAYPQWVMDQALILMLTYGGNLTDWCDQILEDQHCLQNLQHKEVTWVH